MNFQTYDNPSVEGTLPTYIPTGEAPYDSETNHPDTGSRSHQKPAGDQWTVYSPNVLRGNLDSDKDHSNDVRMNVGWNSEVTAVQRGKDMPWMSTFAQQPYLFPSGWAASHDEGA